MDVRRTGKVDVDLRAFSLALKPLNQVLRNNIDATNDGFYNKDIVKSRFRE